MPVGKAGVQPDLIPSGKQSALPAGLGSAASESAPPSDDPVDSSFQQALSSVLDDRLPPVQGTNKLTPSIPVQSASNSGQLPATINPLIPSLLGSLKDSAGQVETKLPVPSRSAPSKEQTPPKDKTAVEREPAQFPATQPLFLTVPIAPEPQIPAQLAAAPDDSRAPDRIATELPSSIQGLPGVPAVPQVKETPTAAPSPASPANAAPDSLSFALMLHPKSAQSPITDTPIMPGATRAKATPSGSQTNEPLTGDSKVPTEVSKVPSIQPVHLAGSDPNASTQPPPVRPHGAVQPVTPLRASQSFSTTATSPQERDSEDLSTSDSSRRPRREASSDSDPAGVAVGSDIAKPVFAAANSIPTSASVHFKPSESASASPAAPQVLTEANAAPSATAKEVVVRLQGQTGESISVRLVDQGGQVQVAVRSSDPATANLLRQDLSSLTSNLDRAGWKPEVLVSAQQPVALAHDVSQGSPNENQNSHSQGTFDWNQQDGSRRRNSATDLWDEILTRQGT
ncbi:MAG TPA: flagellar hook-length control protein FliK [Bryobacteraceae bacterium]